MSPRDELLLGLLFAVVGLTYQAGGIARFAGALGLFVGLGAYLADTFFGRTTTEA
ncbi:hypothetical protein [Halorarius halobius]|uniref:hypothetical protein n=1 Tax=Halorarius halobius TaxID=2962671 RepID=UPI0020CFD976|nr:hypothetical protein [Halorarius halobius]